jgi:hypothetical protein
VPLRVRKARHVERRRSFDTNVPIYFPERIDLCRAAKIFAVNQPVLPIHPIHPSTTTTECRVWGNKGNDPPLHDLAWTQQ